LFLVLDGAQMRLRPITLAIRFLKGRRTLRGAPYYGRPLFSSTAAAVRTLRDFTGQDLGTDVRRWCAWLRENRPELYREVRETVYYRKTGE
jgi:hypothetical protein